MKFIILIVLACLMIFLDAFASDSLVKNKLPEPDNTIKIGLLIQDNNSVEARYAAEMAIRKANSKGGIYGRPIQLIIHTMEGPWGTGSKQAVDMIFNEKVWAIIGSHDGRNAHLVEQASAKTHTVFLSAWASDPTLSQAFVPWFFNCVPNDGQQADALIEEIYNKRKITKVAVVSDNGYDSKLASETFLKTTKKLLKQNPVQLYYDNPSKDFTRIIDEIIKAKVNAIVLLGQKSASIEIVRQIKENKLKQPVFGSLSLLGENEFYSQYLKNYERVVLVSSVDWIGVKGLAFQKEFQKKYDRLPGAVAAYAFDGINLIIEAVRNAGLDREKIQKALSEIHHEGVTGTIQFDDKGNRLGSAGLIEIKNGIPFTIGK